MPYLYIKVARLLPQANRIPQSDSCQTSRMATGLFLSCIQIFPQTAPKNQPIRARSRNIGDGESAGKVQTSDYSLTAKLHSRANTNDALFVPNCKPHSPNSHSSKLITVNLGRYTNKDTHVYDSNHSSASSSTVYNSSAGAECGIILLRVIGGHAVTCEALVHRPKAWQHI